ncbi:hypothetical protein HMN09_00577900 [Mycena chlorophos]|uniref:Protein kinase domain-containing protein n=1 Tax=Mycena chlorophos TaxID=658473 RepID=A0A8H6T506_MYCCL|nr:hypothetical protein HMN09_00577900 [Mycena chlorophos]
MPSNLCRCQLAHIDPTKPFGLRFDPPEDIDPEQTALEYLQAKNPGLNSTIIFEGVLYVVDCAKLKWISNLRMFKSSATSLRKLELVSYRFNDLEMKEFVLCFERRTVRRILLDAAFASPATLAKLGPDLRQCMEHKATRIHGVVPFVPDDKSTPKMITVHGACHVEPIAELWTRFKEIESCLDARQLKTKLLLIRSDKDPRTLQTLLDHARSFITAQTAHTDEATFCADIQPHIAALVGYQTIKLYHTQIDRDPASDASSCSSGGSTAAPDLVTETAQGTRLVTVAKLAGPGDPAVQAVYSWRSAEATQASLVEDMQQMKPSIGLFLAVQPRIVEIGHIFLNLYRVADSEAPDTEDGSWQAAVDHMFVVGGKSTRNPGLVEVLKVAAYFVCVGNALAALDTLRERTEGLPPIAECVFPKRTAGYKMQVDGDWGSLGQAHLLHPNDMRVFRATWTRRNEAPRDVVVKLFALQEQGDWEDFDSEEYGAAAHEVAADAGLAPPLILFGDALPGSKTGWFVAVMDHIPCAEFITRAHIEALRGVPKIFEERGIIHGDLRLPNIVFTLDGAVKIIDWNWAGLTSSRYRPRYPHSLNLGARWARGVVPGVEIEAVHDSRQINDLARALEIRMGDLDFLSVGDVRQLKDDVLYKDVDNAMDMAT